MASTRYEILEYSSSVVKIQIPPEETECDSGWSVTSLVV